MVGSTIIIVKELLFYMELVNDYFVRKHGYESLAVVVRCCHDREAIALQQHINRYP